MKDNCNYLEKVFIDYINGTLDEKDSIFCSNHLKSCDKCKNNEDFKELELTWNLMDKWNTDINPSNNFMAKLQREIVLLEEKQKAFWFKVDSIIAIFRIPMTALFIFVFTLSNNLSYAKTERSFFKENTIKVETKIKDYSQKTITDVIKDFKNIIQK
ncbi:MAG: hypothetical protein U0354_06625 [Candidatus Sericytochromatia bacterium]